MNLELCTNAHYLFALVYVLTFSTPWTVLRRQQKSWFTSTEIMLQYTEPRELFQEETLSACDQWSQVHLHIQTVWPQVSGGWMDSLCCFRLLTWGMKTNGTTEILSDLRKAGCTLQQTRSGLKQLCFCWYIKRLPSCVLFSLFDPSWHLLNRIRLNPGILGAFIGSMCYQNETNRVLVWCSAGRLQRSS